MKSKSSESHVLDRSRTESHVLDRSRTTFFRFHEVGVANRSQFFRFGKVENRIPFCIWRIRFMQNYFTFHIYICPLDSQERDGGAIHRVSN